LEPFKQYFEFSGASEWEAGFRSGAFFAIATILFVTVLLFLLRVIIFRKHQLRQIELDGANGRYIVSSSAIADLLSRKIAEIPEVSLLKIKLFPARNKKCQIVLHINYLPGHGADNLKDLIAKLQEGSLAALAEVFGITNVDSVSICVVRAREKK
jgi:hypothetical protein